MDVEVHQRISASEALRLLKNADTTELMSRAHQVRSLLNGQRIYFVHSLNINQTNICENKCNLCAFWKEADSKEGYILSLDEIHRRLEQASQWQLTDLHVVGGLTHKLDLNYYRMLFRMAKQLLPSVIIQGLTAVEIEWLSRLEGIRISQVLTVLKEAGLDAIPGGGAEIFNPVIRDKICPNKISADQWLNVHRQAHQLGIATNATMLFGHIETPEDVIDHLERLRDLQDQTGGFKAFCPLPFHSHGTRLAIDPGAGGNTITRVVALARIFLDNFPHIRVLANYMQRKLLQTMMYSGADDIGGTSLDEQIAKAAGAGDASKFGSPGEIAAFVENIGFEPILCNSIYHTAKGPIHSPSIVSNIPDDACITLEKVRSGKRLTQSEAILLSDTIPFQQLGQVANHLRHKRVPGGMCTFIIDRNITFTNVCTVGCKFCAFHVHPGSKRAFILPVEEVVRRVVEAAHLGATQIMLQGGLNPALDLAYYENMLRRIKERVSGIWLHSLSPAEIYWLANQAEISIEHALKRLRDAGLDSLPGGGAEILVDEVRQRVSPDKITAEQWFEVIETAQRLGMGTTATMVYGLGESTAQRVEHLMRIRDLQDRTGGFRAFIPWSFQSNRTQLSYSAQTGVDYLRMVALSRLVLDNVEHVQAGWVTEGPDMVELALQFGADDFGGVLMEESVVQATGVDFGMSVEKMLACIRRAGLTPAVRNTQYQLLKLYHSEDFPNTREESA